MVAVNNFPVDAVMDIPPESFGFYSRNERKMTVTPGEYEILYGNSSGPNDLKIEPVNIVRYPFYKHVLEIGQEEK